MNHDYPLIDLALARRLERTEARSSTEFVETRARLKPESGACWIEVAGAYAMFDGVGSPLTQSFGLGVVEPVTEEVLQQLETFFAERDAAIMLEISPLADQSVLPLLHERGYHPVELTSVMFRPIRLEAELARSANPNLSVRLMRADEHELWASTAAHGWSEFAEYAEAIYDLSLMTAARESGLSFFAELNGQPIATGALCLCDNVALLAGASTIPEQRNQGAQSALLEGRLHYAAAQGCDLAMMCAAPGSASQRNAERQGFRIAYTRIKWGKS